jgi:hypothetical protein
MGWDAYMLPTDKDVFNFQKFVHDSCNVDLASFTTIFSVFQIFRKLDAKLFREQLSLKRKRNGKQEFESVLVPKRNLKRERNGFTRNAR